MFIVSITYLIVPSPFLWAAEHRAPNGADGYVLVRNGL